MSVFLQINQRRINLLRGRYIQYVLFNVDYCRCFREVVGVTTIKRHKKTLSLFNKSVFVVCFADLFSSKKSITSIAKAG